MTKSELQKMTKKDLLALAKKKRISVSDSMLKADIVDTVYGKLSKGTGKTRTSVKKKTVTKSKAKTKVKPKAKSKAKAKVKAKAKPKAKAKAKAKDEGKGEGQGEDEAQSQGKSRRKHPPTPVKEWDNGRTIRQKAVAGKYELTAGPVTMPPVESMEIPADYGVTRIVAMAKDPAWLFTYWEITAERFMELEKKFKDDWTKCTMALRVYDRGAKGHFDMNISYEARAWYIGVDSRRPLPGRDRRHHPRREVRHDRRVRDHRDSARPGERPGRRAVAHPRRCSTTGYSPPRAGTRSSRAGGSAEMRRMLEARLEEQLSSEGVSSFGSGELMPGQKERGFRLRVATELILYGATEPDAKVTIQGKPVKLRRDGTFTARGSRCPTGRSRYRSPPSRATGSRSAR